VTLKKRTLVVLMCFFAACNAAFASSADKYLNTAQNYLQQEKYDYAVTYYNEAIKIENRLWQAWLGLGKCYYYMKKYHNAKLIFNYVLILKPGEKNALEYIKLIEPNETAGDKFQSEKHEDKLKGDLIWRSVVFPGFGQFYNGDISRGYFYSIAFITSASLAVKFVLDQQKAVETYRTTNYDFDKKYKAAQEAGIIAIIPFGAMGVIWIAAMIDSCANGSDGAADAVKKVITGIQLKGNVLAYKFYENTF
jgi:tetratricopeptide (TPR) repeat protein